MKINQKAQSLKIWALTDYRAGTTNQVLGVAENIAREDEHFEVIEKKLLYNRLGKLPNGLQQFVGLASLHKVSAAHLSAPYPDIVISAGRRAAVIARYIQERNKAVKLVHIMSPELPFKFFDMIIMPQHDFPPNAKNIVTTLGAPHRLNNDILSQAANQNPLGHFSLPKPWTMLCLGGNTSFGRFMLNDNLALAEQLAPLASEGGSLLITSSRRTPAAIMQMAIESIQTKYPNITIKSYSPDGSSDYNPYHSWVAQAERFVITADSVSMISEAAFTTKPIYIFTPNESAGKKHLHFVQAMIAAGHVKHLRDYDANWQRLVNLNEAKRLSYKIRELFDNQGGLGVQYQLEKGSV